SFFQLGWQRSEVLPHLKLHAVNFGNKSRGRQSESRWIRLDPAQMRELLLKPSDSLLGRLQFDVVLDHVASGIISTIPRRCRSRLYCQSSMNACGSPKIANRRTQKTLAPKCDWAAECSYSNFASPVN